ncbi:hypothetical protein AMECASPLE_015234, partial [Ameca splendens]
LLGTQAAKTIKVHTCAKLSGELDETQAEHEEAGDLRCHSSLAQTLPPEEAPVDRPFWGVDDPGMPLPFDLADIISRVESLLWRM